MWLDCPPSIDHLPRASEDLRNRSTQWGMMLLFFLLVIVPAYALMVLDILHRQGYW